MKYSNKWSTIFVIEQNTHPRDISDDNNCGSICWILQPLNLLQCLGVLFPPLLPHHMNGLIYNMIYRSIYIYIYISIDPLSVAVLIIRWVQPVVALAWAIVWSSGRSGRSGRSCSGIEFFPQHLVVGLLNFRRRVCRSFWLDLAFQDPPGKTDQYYYCFFFFIPPTK